VEELARRAPDQLPGVTRAEQRRARPVREHDLPAAADVDRVRRALEQRRVAALEPRELALRRWPVLPLPQEIPQRVRDHLVELSVAERSLVRSPSLLATARLSSRCAFRDAGAHERALDRLTQQMELVRAELHDASGRIRLRS